MTALTVVTANIGRHATQAQARENVRRVLNRFPEAAIGWQEIDEADEAEEWRILNYWASTNRAVIGRGTATPLMVPAGWGVQARGVRRACRGLAKVTPDRNIVWARVTRWNLDGTGGSVGPIVLANGHYPLARLGEGGQQRWDECHAAWTLFAHHVHEQGWTLITTRDTNQHGPMPLIHPKERQWLGEGIDEISVVPGDVRVERRSEPITLDLDIDGHNAHALTLRVTARD